jgi:hypothetical protein
MAAQLVRAFLFFAGGFVGAYAASVLVFGIWRRNVSAPDGSFLEDAAMGAYVLLVTAVPAAFGFAIVTSPWTAWRNLRPRRSAWISVAGGVLTCLGQVTGLAWLLLLIPLPGGFGAVGAALRLLLPGIAAGAAAVAVVWLLRLAPPADADVSSY